MPLMTSLLLIRPNVRRTFSPATPHQLACSAATVELTRRVGENIGFVKDVHAVWELPVAMLLPLAYAPVLPIIRFTLTQWRIRRVPVHRRAFSAAAIGLSYIAAALVFHALIRLVPGAASISQLNGYDPKRPDHPLPQLLAGSIMPAVQQKG